jgi:hypothetical protein
VNIAALEKALPGLGPIRSVNSMPYARDADRQAIVDALETADRAT